MKVMALPLDQPARSTISCTIGERSGVLSLAPASLSTVHTGTAFQATEAPVLLRPVMSLATAWNAGESSMASPKRTRFVGSVQVISSDVERAVDDLVGRARLLLNGSGVDCGAASEGLSIVV